MDKRNFSNRSELRKFSIGLSVILVVIGTIQLIKGVDLYIGLFFVAIVILFVGLFLPLIIKPLFIVFSYVGTAIGWVVTHVILAALYFIVFTIIGKILRVGRKKMLDLEFRTQSESYWIDRSERVVEKSEYENQY